MPAALQVGADLCMGSLIKSPGGTLAPTGGYIVVCKAALKHLSARLMHPARPLALHCHAAARGKESTAPLFRGVAPPAGHKYHGSVTQQRALHIWRRPSIGAGHVVSPSPACRSLGVRKSCS